MNHRSNEDTDHDMRVGIPLPMPLVDGGGEVERLRAALQNFIEAVKWQGWDNEGEYFSALSSAVGVAEEALK